MKRKYPVLMMGMIGVLFLLILTAVEWGDIISLHSMFLRLFCPELSSFQRPGIPRRQALY